MWTAPSFRYAFVMVFKEIYLEEIDIEDETYRISEELDSQSVLDSLREIGQLNPVLVLDGNPRKVIVCGFRRVRAMRHLGKPQVLARVLSENTSDSVRTLELALWDNLSHRKLEPLEQARALFKLQNVYGVSNDRLVETYLPFLGLAPHESVLHTYLVLHGIRPGLRRCLVEGLLTCSSIEHLAEMPYQVQDSVAGLMIRIRLSASLQRKVLGLLDDLSFAALDSPEVLDALEDPRLTPFQKGEKVHEFLYRLKNPRLLQALERFAALKKLLGLPGSIRVAPHPFFETPDVHVEFEASSAGRFRELAAALQKAAQLQELEELFRLDGDSEACGAP